MKWLAIRATEEDHRSVLQAHPGIEVMAEGGTEDLGAALLDLLGFRLSPEAAREVAQRAGLDVAIGWKAVFTVRDAG